MTEIYFVRHGETAKNKEKLLQGRSNLPMNEKGIRQAEGARDFLREQGIRFDVIYSSPLQRAVRTAMIVAGLKDDTKIIRDDRLLEMDYGPYEGLSLEHPSPEVLDFLMGSHKEPEGMEKLAHVTARMGGFLEEIRRSGSGRGRISTHAIAMKGALEYLTPGSNGGWWPRELGNCDVFVTEVQENGFSLPRAVYANRL